MKRARLLLVAVFAVSTMVVFSPPAHACEYEGDPMCRPCGDRVNAITQKLYGEDLITCPW
jgi:hypothetical protein